MSSNIRLGHDSIANQATITGSGSFTNQAAVRRAIAAVAKKNGFGNPVEETSDIRAGICTITNYYITRNK